MTTICVVGAGFVGGSLAHVFAERGLSVVNYDKAGKCATGCIQPTWCNPRVGFKQPVTSIDGVIKYCELQPNFSNVYFVCLPTPMFDDGECDLSIVECVLRELASVPGDRIAVVKSTVPPGSTERWNREFEKTGLRVVFSPEFLREATALNDMRNQDRIILGGPKKNVDVVKQVFQIAFPDVKIVKTSSTNAELTKYITNCFLAMKVSFANEIYQVCEKLAQQGIDVDYDRTIECAKLDKRLGESHWSVPSFEKDTNGKPLFGYSLSCFPKDVNALTFKAKELGVKPTMLEATWLKNLEVRPGMDWCQMKGRAVSEKKK